jgi:hypothetical protein
MAASFVTTSASLEGQALEIALKLQLEEQAYNIANPNTPVNRVTISPNTEANEISITINMPSTLSGAGAAMTQTVTPYLP